MVQSEIRENVYNNSVILITGGTGSIGLELAKSLINYKPKQIRLFSNDENGLFQARALFFDHSEVTYRFGDVRDLRSLESAIEGCDFVFHAAALKHVDFCEMNPYEAVSTNILGTQNVIEAAIKHHVKKFIFISTDKAVNPLSAMGATKLLGEKLVISASKTTNRTTFSIVRFGNVLGSRGSVILIFKEQVKNRNIITVTDPNMTRFIMLPSDAARLVLRAGEIAKSGEILVLRMKAVKIGDLAEACREFFAKMYGRNPEDIRIIKVGSRPGEKIHEELMTESEASNVIEIEDFYIINYNPERIQASKFHPTRAVGYTSNTAPLLSKEEIISLLSQLYSQSRYRNDEF